MSEPSNEQVAAEIERQIRESVKTTNDKFGKHLVIMDKHIVEEAAKRLRAGVTGSGDEK